MAAELALLDTLVVELLSVLPEHLVQGRRVRTHDLNGEAVTILRTLQDLKGLLRKQPCVEGEDPSTAINMCEDIRDHLVFGSETRGESDLRALKSVERPGERIESRGVLAHRLQSFGQVIHHARQPQPFLITTRNVSPRFSTRTT